MNEVGGGLGQCYRKALTLAKRFWLRRTALLSGGHSRPCLNPSNQMKDVKRWIASSPSVGWIDWPSSNLELLSLARWLFFDFQNLRRERFRREKLLPPLLDSAVGLDRG